MINSRRFITLLIIIVTGIITSHTLSAQTVELYRDRQNAVRSISNWRLQERREDEQYTHLKRMQDRIYLLNQRHSSKPNFFSARELELLRARMHVELSNYGRQRHTTARTFEKARSMIVIYNIRYLRYWEESFPNNTDVSLNGVFSNLLPDYLNIEPVAYDSKLLAVEENEAQKVNTTIALRIEYIQILIPLLSKRMQTASPRQRRAIETQIKHYRLIKLKLKELQIIIKKQQSK